jgi:AcrR family transcriptional regulator
MRLGVANAAGISVGSLYRYFPNRFSLIEAVRRRHFAEVLAVFQAATDESKSRSRRIAAFVDGMIAVHSRRPAAHRVLLEEAPGDTAPNSMHSKFETQYRRRCEAFFSVNARAVRPMAAQMLAAAVAGVVHAAARGRL